MKNNQAIFNAIDKTITFMFEDQIYTIDLTEGDLEDSWQGIITKNGIIYDTNFSYQYDENEVYIGFTLYPVEEDLTTIFGSDTDITFDIVEQIGTQEDYLGKPVSEWIEDENSIGWKTERLKEYIELDKDEYSAEEWDLLTKILVGENKTVEIIRIHENTQISIFSK